MYKQKKILGLIPARGGSKRLPGKNIKVLNNKPLIAWTIEQALNSKFLDKVIVSTDDKEIAHISKQFRAEVPFIRPDELSSDKALSIDVAIHALEFLKTSREEYDYLALLEPTSPLRKPDDIDNGIRKLIDLPEADGLVSWGLVHLEHPMIVKRLKNNFMVPYTNLPQIKQSQEADEAYFPYGVIYLSKVESLYKNNTFYPEKTIPLLIERWQNYEIDDEVDFFVIEILIKKYMSVLSKEIV